MNIAIITHNNCQKTKKTSLNVCQYLLTIYEWYSVNWIYISNPNGLRVNACIGQDHDIILC